VPVVSRRLFWSAVLIVYGTVLALPIHCSEREYQNAVLLQGAAYSSCHYDCAPFDRPTLYFCIQFGSEILVGSRGADPIWAYDSSRMFALAGKSVSMRHNGDDLWLRRPDGKDMHLKKDYSNDVFSDAACSAAVRKRWVQKFAAVAPPQGVPQSAALVPLTERSYFWVQCHLDPQKGWDSCKEWGSKGDPDTQRELVDPATQAGVGDGALDIDPIATEDKAALHLKNGIVLRDWAKGRINGVPAPGSVPPTAYPRPQ
jgi:hypothetical protein